MSQMLPPSRPRLTEPEARALLLRHGVDEPVMLLDIRAYYRDSMGEPGKNDRAIYDDAMMVVAQRSFATFNANSDPSICRKGVAVLATGVWRYKIGIHGLSKPAHLRYEALVQAAPVTVIRDGTGPDTGWFGINIHRGGNTTTSSLGCQTIPPAQWPAFFAFVKSVMAEAKVKTVPCLLMEGPVR